MRIYLGLLQIKYRLRNINPVGTPKRTMTLDSFMYLKNLSEKNAQNKCRKEKRDLMLLHKLPENDANDGITMTIHEPSPSCRLQSTCAPNYLEQTSVMNRNEPRSQVSMWHMQKVL